MSVCNFPETNSKVKSVPDKYKQHLGVFCVPKGSLNAYLAQYNPVILRLNKITNTALCEGRRAHNFGEAKGCGFERVLILPTEKYKEFLAGDITVFDNDKTHEARNKLYVAITRARYSVAFFHDGPIGLAGITQWQDGP